MVTDNVEQFEAEVYEEDERNRLMAYLKEENMSVSTLIHNQPFMLQPVGMKK